MKWRGFFFKQGSMCVCTCKCVYECISASVCVCVWLGGGAAVGEWHMAYSLAPVTHMGTTHSHTNKHKWTHIEVRPCCLMWFGAYSQFSIHWNISMRSLAHATRDWLCLRGFISVAFPLVLFFCVAMACNILIFPFLYIKTLAFQIIFFALWRV